MKTKEYQDRKAQRFRSGDELVIAKNPAFLLRHEAQRKRFAAEYVKSEALYYKGQPRFDEILSRIQDHIQDM